MPRSVYDWVNSSATPIKTLVASPDDDFSDLAAFGNAVGDAHIVSLTEDTHGDANAFELMNRQVQYLHKVKGFEVLLMESAMFDVEAIWRSATNKNASVVDLAPNRIFFMYSKSDAGRKVLSYVDQQRATATPLLLGGVDVPLGGATSIDEIVPALTSFLQSRNSTALQHAQWASFASVAKRAAELTSGGMDHAGFDAVAAQLQNELCSDNTQGATPRETPGWWCLQIKGLVADVVRQANLPQMTIPDPRDKQMAENVMWSMTHLYPGKKVILWSNTGHGTVLRTCKNGNCVLPSSMASYLRDSRGADLYVVKNTAKEGSVVDYTDTTKSWALDSMPSYETLSLDELGKTPAFLNQPSDPALIAALLSFPGPTFTLGPDSTNNGLFYYKTAVPAIFKEYATTPLP